MRYLLVSVLPAPLSPETFQTSHFHLGVSTTPPVPVLARRVSLYTICPPPARLLGSLCPTSRLGYPANGQQCPSSAHHSCRPLIASELEPPLY